MQVRISTKRDKVRDLDMWTEADSAAVAEAVVATIIGRIYQGQGADGEPFAPYSTRPTTISLGSETAMRLTPKGGQPVKDKTGKVTGVRYPNGYAQYKHESRRRSARAGTAEVDLTLSGQLVRSIRVVTADESTAVVGVTGAPQEYADALDSKRPFLGLTAAEAADIEEEVVARINAHVAGTGAVRPVV